MTNLRAAVIGLGSMGRHHARILGDTDGIEFVGAVDPMVVSDSEPFPVWHYLDSLLCSGRPDIAVIAVPTTWHLPVAFGLAAAGVHMLVEKPLASTERNARELIDAVGRAGVQAAVGHVERFNPAIGQLHERIRSLGRIHMIQTVRSGPHHGRTIDTGVIRDLATHDLDLVEWLGGPVDTIHAETVHAGESTHEDLATVTGRTERGVVFSCTTDWLSPAKTRRTHVIGEHGTLTADAIRPRLTLHKHGKPAVDYVLDRVEPLRAELEAFARLVRTGERGRLASLAEGLMAVVHADTALHATPLRSVPDVPVAA